MDHFLTIQNFLNLVTLTGLEIILGIDNVIFIALIVQKLPFNMQDKVRVSGLSLALILRIMMLFTASWIITLKKPIMQIGSFSLSGRGMLLIAGGIFLLWKTITEIKELYKNIHSDKNVNITGSFSNAVMQIIFIDLILSFDSIITAVGVSNNLPTIIIAIIISMAIMLLSSESIGKFIENNPNIKVIALCFIGLIGIILVLNGINIDISKGYLYFAVFFSILIESINITLKKRLNK